MKHSELMSAIQDSICNEAKSFNRTIEHFAITFGNNAYPERMVSYHYINALSTALPDSHVVLEVPIKGRDSVNYSNHIDAIVFNEDILVIAEFKRVYNPRHWRWIEEDIDRVTNGAKQEICSNERFRNFLPRDTYFFIGADCFLRNIALAWIDESTYRKWIRPRGLNSGYCRFNEVYRAEEINSGFDGYNLTWGLIPLNMWFIVEFRETLP